MEETDLIIKNLEILRKAQKACTCDGSEPHYHELLHYDTESGDEYRTETDDEHKAFMGKLERDLEKLQRQRR
jgi:hypothetical protein